MHNSIFQAVKAKYSFEPFVLSLLPGGKRSGYAYYPLNPTRTDNKPGSFVVDFRKQIWSELASPSASGNDIISLYAYIKGVSQHEAAKMLSDLVHYNLKAQNIIHTPPKVPKPPKVDSGKLIRKIWSESQPVGDSIVETYLGSIGYDGDIPKTIKYHRGLKHPQTNSYYPAMVAAISAWPSFLEDGISGEHIKEPYQHISKPLHNVLKDLEQKMAINAAKGEGRNAK